MRYFWFTSGKGKEKKICFNSQSKMVKRWNFYSELYTKMHYRLSPSNWTPNKHNAPREISCNRLWKHELCKSTCSILKEEGNFISTQHSKTSWNTYKVLVQHFTEHDQNFKALCLFRVVNNVMHVMLLCLLATKWLKWKLKWEVVSV